jgi:hypothetical protein
LSAASFSTVVPGRGNSSCSNRTGSPFALWDEHGNDLTLKRPVSIAARFFAVTAAIRPVVGA